MNNRRFTLYFAWDKKLESSKCLGSLDNRYPTLFEVRRFVWPQLETLSNSQNYSQDISGFLDHIVLSDFEGFRTLIADLTSQEVHVCERNSDSGITALNTELLNECDTLIVISLDHQDTKQSLSEDEEKALKDFLRRDNTCLLICPHHDVGSELVTAVSEAEKMHHGDVLVPASQRLGGFAQSIFSCLDIPVKNKWGLHPAKDERGNPAQLLIDKAKDSLNILKNVSTFNNHSHLPHFEIQTSHRRIEVLAKQPIDSSAPSHPLFVDSRYFNALLWCPPKDDVKGNIFICDATLFSGAFKGLESLRNFWRNLGLL